MSSRTAYCSDPLEISSLSSLKETVDAVGDDASQQHENFQNKGRTNSLYMTNPGSGNILFSLW